MQLTITRFRQDLFRLADEAIHGEPVQFVYKGVVFKVIAQGAPTTKKLDRLVGQATLDPETDLQKAGKDLAAEMEAAWTKDWSAI